MLPLWRVNIKALGIELVQSYEYHVVHLDDKMDWSVNTDVLYKKFFFPQQTYSISLHTLKDAFVSSCAFLPVFGGTTTTTSWIKTVRRGQFRSGRECGVCGGCAGEVCEDRVTGHPQQPRAPPPCQNNSLLSLHFIIPIISLTEVICTFIFYFFCSVSIYL